MQAAPRPFLQETLSPLGEHFARSSNPTTRYLAAELGRVWSDFDKRLGAVPLVARIETRQISRDEYLALLLDLHAQVVEGSRWIAHAAASMDASLFSVRSALLAHAAQEQLDFQMLEENYVALGGNLDDIKKCRKNIGSEAFSEYMFHQAQKPNPLHLFGAMFIIEGLGASKAARWANLIKQALNLHDDEVSFLSYHGKNDDRHYDKLRAVLSAPFITQPIAQAVVRCAKVVGRLYVLQLEEIGNY